MSVPPNQPDTRSPAQRLKEHHFAKHAPAAQPDGTAELPDSPTGDLAATDDSPSSPPSGTPSPDTPQEKLSPRSQERFQELTRKAKEAAEKAEAEAKQRQALEEKARSLEEQIRQLRSQEDDASFRKAVKSMSLPEDADEMSEHERNAYIAREVAKMQSERSGLGSDEVNYIRESRLRDAIEDRFPDLSNKQVRVIAKKALEVNSPSLTFNDIRVLAENQHPDLFPKARSEESSSDDDAPTTYPQGQRQARQSRPPASDLERLESEFEELRAAQRTAPGGPVRGAAEMLRRRVEINSLRAQKTR